MADLGNKDELEKALLVGIHGAPELRRAERRRFLGFFRERVIEAVTFSQLKGKGLQAMSKAVLDPRAVELVIHQDARQDAMPLMIQARKKGLDFTIVSNPDFIGKVAVVLVAADAVDIPRLLAEEEKAGN
ncbi:MAG TPA: YueI family protein [Firmicutes bacterium]|nr:YueI family protein [Bacillota bacterium]